VCVCVCACWQSQTPSTALRHTHTHIHTHTHTHTLTRKPRPQTLELWGSSPIARDSRQKISRLFTLQKPNFEQVKRQMTVAKETRFVFFVCLYTKSKFEMHICKTNGRWLSQTKQGLVFVNKRQMTVAQETRFSFFRIVTFLHNKTNFCCKRIKISFFSCIYIFCSYSYIFFPV